MGPRKNNAVRFYNHILHVRTATCVPRLLLAQIDSYLLASKLLTRMQSNMNKITQKSNSREHNELQFQLLYTLKSKIILFPKMWIFFYIFFNAQCIDLDCPRVFAKLLCCCIMSSLQKYECQRQKVLKKDQLEQ